MEVLSAVPSVTVTEQLAVQPLADLAGAQSLRANVWTLAAGDWSWGRHVHREQEELYLVLDGRLRIEAGGETLELGPGEALVVPAGVAAPALERRRGRRHLPRRGSSAGAGRLRSGLTHSSLASALGAQERAAVQSG